ncbi:hypothetical protein [Absidia glauca]|uniref:Uncharacterized protein n=1 Tax=Absidia glauca TaxID=4829 RepID=A0A168LRE3_ABSGL|nr:hypothetical protein [Absidia glauca]
MPSSHHIGTRADSRHIQDLRTAAFNELRQSIQTYTDSFVLSMQCQEREERRRKRPSNKGADETQQEDSIDSRMMNELALVLQSGTINDYMPVLESEQQGSSQLVFGDLWL